MKKKKFAVYPREKEITLNGFDTSRGHRDFHGKTLLYVDEPSEAREIDQKFGKNGTGELIVAEDEQYARALNGEHWEVRSNLKGDNVKLLHNYTFGPQTSRAAAEFWERYEKKKKRTKRRKHAEVQHAIT